MSVYVYVTMVDVSVRIIAVFARFAYIVQKTGNNDAVLWQVIGIGGCCSVNPKAMLCQPSSPIVMAVER